MWKSLRVNSKFYFRPYVEMNDEEIGSNVSNELSSVEPLQDRFYGNSATTNELKMGMKCSQSLLYMHQEQWQQRLMEMYGNTISLIDATYKTTKYDLALFLLL